MRKALLLLGILAFDTGVYLKAIDSTREAAPPPSSLVVLGYNDLGMHCMNEDFSEICVLPPANTLRAQVIDTTGEDPRIVKKGVSIRYSIPGNTISSTKTNFWQYAQRLFGVNLPANVGLFGYRMSGIMRPTEAGDFAAYGIPITPITDAGVFDPYQLARITARTERGSGSTEAVVPVSWEMRCDTCHTTPGISVATDILRKHDQMHGTTLESQKPVLCARCHADPAIGAPGSPGVSNLSAAMHGAHAGRMGSIPRKDMCYSCHPGPQTQCLRDVHKTGGMDCVSCHGGMAAVASPARRPWQDEPKCGDCHNVPGHEYEQPGVLFRDSVGHHGVKCIACHGSPHAIAPSENPRDNKQAIALQGYAGTIDKCTVCHKTQPHEPFDHKRDDD